MALLNNREELESAWRALRGSTSDDGWRTILVKSAGRCQLRAGRHFPSNGEALLVGFSDIGEHRSIPLPKGQGFNVDWADLDANSSGYVWISLYREVAGNVEMFSLMADDIRSVLETYSGAEGMTCLHAFLARIRAWQEFMRRGPDRLLSIEAEIGLFGEIDFLTKLIAAGMTAAEAVDSWKGPLGGLQDFVIGAGAIEVKTTASAAGFQARVGSLDQLDDSVVRPLYLAGIRLSQSDTGLTLPEKIADVRISLHPHVLIMNTFDTRLLQLGYREADSMNYSRRFTVVGHKLMLVNSDFPRLIRANVRPEIVRAAYDVELDLITNAEIMIDQALVQLGVISG